MFVREPPPAALPPGEREEGSKLIFEVPRGGSMAATGDAAVVSSVGEELDEASVWETEFWKVREEQDGNAGGGRELSKNSSGECDRR